MPKTKTKRRALSLPKKNARYIGRKARRFANKLNKDFKLFKQSVDNFNLSPDQILENYRQFLEQNKAKVLQEFNASSEQVKNTTLKNSKRVLRGKNPDGINVSFKLSKREKLRVGHNIDKAQAGLSHPNSMLNKNLTASKIDKYNKKTLKQIKKKLSGLKKEKLTPEEIKRQFDKELGKLHKRKLDSMGNYHLRRTGDMTRNSANNGIVEGLRKNHKTLVVWKTMLDSKVRDTHASVHGKARKKEGLFTLQGKHGVEGCKFPRDPTLSPGNRYGCRCQTIVKVYKSRKSK